MGTRNMGGVMGQQHMQQPRAQQQMMHMSQPIRTSNPPAPTMCYRTLYDYEAQDVDEVSFLEGDLIVDCTPVSIN